MSDVIVFGFGVVVTLMVAAAVALLLWGAANETEDSETRPGAGGPGVPRRSPSS